MTRRDVGALAAAILATFAALISGSTLAIASADGARIGLLSLSIAAVLTAVAAGLAVGWLARLGASLAPLWLLALVVLPWTPLPLPPAFLVLAGPLRLLLWVGVFGILIATLWPLVIAGRVLPSVATLVRKNPQVAAGVLAAVVFSFSAWRVSPSLPAGDEPHYLVITQSLLLDHDIKIENNHRRGDYQAYYARPLAPHYIRRGVNGEIYSIHAPGLSALVAPAFAAGGYRAVVLFLVAIAACGSALAWHLARLASGSAGAAWFGWAAVTCAATTIFHSFTIYPDGVGGVVVLTGVWALLRAEQERRDGEERVLPWLLHGLALALLPWLHSRFAVLAGCLGALVLLRVSTTRNAAGKAVAFLAIPAVSAMAWMTFFRVVYGISDPSAPYGSTREFSLSFIPGGLSGLLFDQRFGLIANSPVLLVAIAGLAMMLMQPRRSNQIDESPGLADRRLALELVFVIVPYLLTATSYAMWWAGWSAPARFADPAVLALAIPAAVAWSRIRNRGSRAVAAGLLVVTLFQAAVLVLVDGGRLAYNTRETTALWLDWASRLAALADGVPIWFRGREADFGIDIAIWLVAFLLAWGAARSLSSRVWLGGRGRFLTSVTAIHLAAAMLAVAVVWARHGHDGALAEPAELDLLRAVAREPRTVALQVTPPRVISQERLLERLSIAPPLRTGRSGGRGRIDPTLAVLPDVPAGRYRLHLEGGGASGTIMIGIGQDQFALRTETIAWPAAPIDIDFPLDVGALIVRADEDARRAIRRIVVEPLSIVAPGSRLTNGVARRAAKYATASVFFLDEQSFAEPDGFWLVGARESTFVVQPDRPSGSMTLLVRNAPVENRVTLVSGQWREQLSLAPGEERHIQMPLNPAQKAALITATVTAGFRPSQSVPDSRDDRFLGVWFEFK